MSEPHGLSTRGWGGWLRDQATSPGVSVVLWITARSSARPAHDLPEPPPVGPSEGSGRPRTFA